MTKEEIFQKIKETLCKEFEVEADSVTAGAELFGDLDLDSIDAVDLLTKMKEFARGKIDPERFKKARTVQDLVDILYLMTADFISGGI